MSQKLTPEEIETLKRSDFLPEWRVELYKLIQGVKKKKGQGLGSRKGSRRRSHAQALGG